MPTLDHIIDHIEPYANTFRMSEAVKKVTVNLPSEVLARARKITGSGITETIVAGLQELERARQRQALRALRGQVKFNLNLKETRR
jgi:hypothetical protein